MDKYFHPTLKNGCDYFSKLEFKLIYVKKGAFVARSNIAVKGKGGCHWLKQLQQYRIAVVIKTHGVHFTHMA